MAHLNSSGSHTDYTGGANDSQPLPWKRLLAEAATIVVSIFLAFAIDAWWEDRGAVARPQPRDPLIVDAELVNHVLDRFKLQQIALRDIQPVIEAADSILLLLEDEIRGQ